MFHGPCCALKCISYPRIISWFSKSNVDITIIKKVIETGGHVGQNVKANIVFCPILFESDRYFSKVLENNKVYDGLK